MSRRLALLISNNQYSDANLTKLAAPVADAEALARVLRDPAIGAFDDVQTLINQPSADVRHAIAGFFHGKQPNDLLLLYFSGHGLLDDRSRLYLATSDTDAKLPRSRSVDAAYIAQEMDDSRSKRQVLILDCCHSGAFRQGITKSSVGQPVQTRAIFDDGDGRVVLAASDATQYAFEGETLVGQGVRSVFTHYLVEGLTNLNADANGDGQVTVDELYEYLYPRVTAHTPTQTPVKWNYKQRGIFVLAGQGIPMPTATSSTLSSTPITPKAPNYRTWVVDQMHRGDFTMISEAIAAANAGDKIVIRPGLYEEGLVIDKPLEIEGEGEANEVVIQSLGKHTIRFHAPIGQIRNLTLRQQGGEGWYCVDIAQGRLLLEGCDISSQSLACVAIHDEANPTVRHNRIHDGKSIGIYIYKQGQGTIVENDIYANAEMGIAIRSGNPTVRTNRIYDGKGSGILVYEIGLGVIEANDIFANAHAGITVTSGGNPRVFKNRIHDSLSVGIFIWGAGQGTINENDIYANAESQIVIESGSDPVIRNNSIHHGKSGGIWVHKKGHGRIEKNDIFANTTYGIEISEDGNPTVYDNHIHQNGFQAVRIFRNGSGTFIGNTLEDHQGGTWKIDDDCLFNVIREGNIEKYR